MVGWFEVFLCVLVVVFGFFSSHFHLTMSDANLAQEFRHHFLHVTACVLMMDSPDSFGLLTCLVPPVSYSHLPLYLVLLVLLL